MQQANSFLLNRQGWLAIPASSKVLAVGQGINENRVVVAKPLASWAASVEETNAKNGQ